MKISRTYGIPVIALDYCSRSCRRQAPGRNRARLPASLSTATVTAGSNHIYVMNADGTGQIPPHDGLEQ